MPKFIPLSITSEENLVEGLIKNNPATQRYFFENYKGKLLAICFRYLKNEDEALDALNRSFLKIFDKIHTYKAETKLENWIIRITVNTCLDLIKANKSYKKNFIQTDEFTIYGEPVEETDDIQAYWQKASEIPAEQLLLLIEQLPPATRTIFNLYAIDGFTHPQIAQELKISTGTSKWHLNNARKLLKEKITAIIANKNFNHGTRFREK